jgi:hypothetical protein
MWQLNILGIKCFVQIRPFWFTSQFLKTWKHYKTRPCLPMLVTVHFVICLSLQTRNDTLDLQILNEWWLFFMGNYSWWKMLTFNRKPNTMDVVFSLIPTSSVKVSRHLIKVVCFAFQFVITVCISSNSTFCNMFIITNQKWHPGSTDLEWVVTFFYG